MHRLSGMEEEPTQLVSATLIASIYELALRLDVKPRTIADSAFTSICGDVTWEKKLRPALIETLGREDD